MQSFSLTCVFAWVFFPVCRLVLAHRVMNVCYYYFFLHIFFLCYTYSCFHLSSYFLWMRMRMWMSMSVSVCVCVCLTPLNPFSFQLNALKFHIWWWSINYAHNTFTKPPTGISIHVCAVCTTQCNVNFHILSHSLSLTVDGSLYHIIASMNTILFFFSFKVFISYYLYLCKF